MNPYRHLVGAKFVRDGVRYTVLRCEGATVVGAHLHNGRMHRVLIPLAQVLDALDVTHVELTQPDKPELEAG